MEFNTAPIWSIISILFVVTILLVVWYFYNEIFVLKNRIFSIERFLEPSMNEDPYDSDEENGYNEYTEEIEEPEQEELEEELEEYEEPTEPPQEPEELEPEEQDEFLEQHALSQSQGCVHVLASGKRKGQECGKPTKEGDKCVTHC